MGRTRFVHTHSAGLVFDHGILTVRLQGNNATQAPADPPEPPAKAFGDEANTTTSAGFGTEVVALVNKLQVR
jgi:hypothetical protein